MVRISEKTEFVGEIAYFDFIERNISSLVRAMTGLPIQRVDSSDWIVTAPSISPRSSSSTRSAVTRPPEVECSRIWRSVE